MRFGWHPLDVEDVALAARSARRSTLYTETSTDSHLFTVLHFPVA